MARPILVGMVLLVALRLHVVQAATHEVQVEDFVVYYPDDIQITVGDTVRWVNLPGGSFHDVTADDHSWGSPVGREWTYERTFTTVGKFGYHCAYHDPNDADGTHRGIVRVMADESTLTINPGLSDAWYDPHTTGQGFFIIVWDEIKTIFLSWFTFDTERPPEDVTAILGEPGHRWLTALGSYSGDTATLDVFRTNGGLFDSEEPPAVTDPAPVGTITITWTGCNAGILSYNLPSLALTGDIPIERIVLSNVAACEAAQAE